MICHFEDPFFRFFCTIASTRFLGAKLLRQVNAKHHFIIDCRMERQSIVCLFPFLPQSECTKNRILAMELIASNKGKKEIEF